ncbi:MAG: aldehyde ferredoxin oxidoreductase C-terminal domain-containing protein, partial [Candidatus Heimdallarchaeota archaeon]
IAAKGRGPLPEVADPENTLRLWRQTHKALISDDIMRRWGTGYAGFEVAADTSSEPIRNWQEEWHNEKRFGGPRFDTRYWVKRYHSDFNCTTSCMSVACIKTGRWKGDITDMPDYENQAYLGPNLGIFDPGDTIHLSSFFDNYGLGTINTANTMGFAAELYQRGILTKEDLGFELNWGDAEAFTKLAQLIMDRQGVGDILAEGTYRAALRLGKMKGVNLMPYVVHVKGITIGAHGTRSGEDYVKDYDYAASVQAGDHTSAAHMWDWVFCDTAVVCGFAFKKEFLWEFAQAVTGWEITEERWEQVIAPRILTIQRAALLEAGPDVFWDPDKDDDNPPRFYEPLPSGPFKGKADDRESIKRGVTKYYADLGWDERGIPTQERLLEMGLEDLDRTFEKFRK